MRSPLGQNRGGTPIGVRIPAKDGAAVPAARQVDLRLSAFRFLLFVSSLRANGSGPSLLAR